MRRLAGTLALFCLLGGLLRAANPQKEKAPRFEPIQVVSAVQTIYPLMSLGFGTVILQVTVDKAGAIRKVEVIHGIPSLTEEAERSVRQWKFKPAQLDGKPVASPMVASFTFNRPLINQF